MSRQAALACCLGALLCAGCKTGVTEADQQRVNKEFSRESYEEAMRKLGKEKELEKEKAKEAAYKASQGGDSDQDAGQH